MSKHERLTLDNNVSRFPERIWLKPTDVAFGMRHGDRTLTNKEMGSWEINTASGKFLTELGIEQKTWTNKRYVARNQSVFSMALDAAREALDNWEQTHGRNEKIDAIFFSTTYPTGKDLALEIQKPLGITANYHLNIHAACSGGPLAFNILRRNKAKFLGKNIMIIASEMHSQYLVDLEKEENPAKTDPAFSQTIFSDGAAATIFKLGKGIKLLSSLSTDFRDVEGLNRDIIRMPYDKSLIRGPTRVIPVSLSKSGKIEQDGIPVFKFMLRHIPDLIKKVTKKAELSPTDLDLVICHPGSGQLLGGIALELQTFVDYPPPPKDTNKKYNIYNKSQGIVPPFYNGIADSGNWSSGATIKAEHDAIEEGIIGKGSTIVVVGLGGGPFATAYCAELG
jgi:3-oxoacyl-[acyl-carrier-protein] synthase-3